MTYEKFKNTILDLFINNDDIYYEKKYSKKERQEFVDNNNFDYKDAYKEECNAYDEGDKTVFEKENLETYLINLSFECFIYHGSKDEPVKEIDESEYPMTLDEFTEKVTEKLIEDCHNIYGDDRETTLGDLNNALQEDSTLISAEYDRYCDIYDNSLGRSDVSEIYPFDKLSNAVYAIRMWLYF